MVGTRRSGTNNSTSQEPQKKKGSETLAKMGKKSKSKAEQKNEQKQENQAKSLFTTFLEQIILQEQLRDEQDEEPLQDEDVPQEKKAKNIIRTCSLKSVTGKYENDSDISYDEGEEEEKKEEINDNNENPSIDEMFKQPEDNNSYDFGPKKSGFQKVLLAHTWNDSIDPTGYYVSEKLDGIRGYWDGSHFYSRNGNVFQVPDFFTENFPKVPLDGELFMGRGDFQECSKIVLSRTNASESFQKNRTMDPEGWKKIQYRVFDLPQSDKPFEERYKILRSLIPKIKSKYIDYERHVQCESLDHMKQIQNAVLNAGGEGLMLRVADSQYERKRSKSILKVKVFRDSEAKCIRKNPAKDSVVCYDIYDPEKKEFSIRETVIINVGRTFTYKFFELTHNGIPRFPTFLRFRKKE